VQVLRHGEVLGRQSRGRDGRRHNLSLHLGFKHHLRHNNRLPSYFSGFSNNFGSPKRPPVCKGCATGTKGGTDVGVGNGQPGGGGGGGPPANGGTAPKGAAAGDGAVAEGAAVGGAAAAEDAAGDQDQPVCITKPGSPSAPSLRRRPRCESGYLLRCSAAMFTEWRSSEQAMLSLLILLLASAALLALTFNGASTPNWKNALRGAEATSHTHNSHNSIHVRHTAESIMIHSVLDPRWLRKQHVCNLTSRI
jgi:hypothetical protein